MPYDVVPRGNQFCVIKQSDGSTVKCHDTMGQAEAHQQALYTSYYAEGEGKAFSYLTIDDASDAEKRIKFDRLSESAKIDLFYQLIDLGELEL